MKRILIFFIALINFGLQLKAQTVKIQDVTSPSPMAYELGKFGVDKPNLYTGTASILIPLHTINFDGWKLPLSLSYDASGIRANQDASEVGLGWALNSTGVITRIVKTNNDLNTGEDSFTFPGYVYQEESPVDFFNDIENGLGTHSGLDVKSFDGEPDDFNYNFFGYSGGFVFDKKKNGAILIRQKQKNGVEISFNEANSSFDIITPTGFIGAFSIKEKSTNFSGGKSSSTGPYDSSSVDFLQIKNKGNFRVISAWYLDKITSPSGKEIFFEYNIDQNQSSTYVSLSQPAFGENIAAGTSISFSRTAHEHVYLTGIKIPNEFSISFTMEDREDVVKNFMFKSAYPVTIQKPKRYRRILISGLHPESTFTKNIVLEQSYFNQEYLYNHSTPDYNGESNKYQMLRGRLDHVFINDQKYTFEYNNGLKGLPAKSTRGIDHFSYYNGRDANWTLWSLKTFVSNVKNLDTEGFIGIVLPDLNDTTTDTWKFFSDPQKQVYFQHTTRKPNIDYALAGSLKKVIYPTKGSTFYYYDALEYFAPGLTDPINRPTFTGFPYHNNIGAEAYAYLSSSGLPEFTNSGTVSAGGLRIQAIENRDEKNNMTSKTLYEYTDLNGISSGKLLTPLLYPQGYQQINSPYNILFRAPSSLSSSITAQGKRVGYSRVIEKQEDASGNGYETIYEFKNERINIEDLLNTRQYTNHTYKNGKIKKVTSFNDANSPVKKDEQIETDLESNTINAVTYFTNSQYNENWFVFTKLSKTPIIQPLTKQTTTTTYSSSSNESIETTSINHFNENGQAIETSTQSSDGKALKKEVKYLTDYTNTNCVNASEGNGCLRNILLQNNRKNLVLEEVTYVDSEVASAIGSRYDLEHGNVVLKEVFSYNKSMGEYTPSVNGFEFTGSYESRITYDDYDVDGNLLQQTLKNGRPVSYIWGYNNDYPIVKGENITHLNLLTAYNASQGANYEAAIRAHAATAGAFITTYQYNPMVGTTRMTDPRGASNTYTYNILNQLKEIKDLDQNVVQGYAYNYATLEKKGGLTIPSTVAFGTVTPSAFISKSIAIKNTGNYDITVFGISLPQYFSSPWGNKNFKIRPNETFDFPVTFNAPSYSVNVNSNITISSNHATGTTANTSLTAQVILNGTPNLVLQPNCYILNSEFQTKQIVISNTGNAPLYIENITSNDACIKSSWEDIKTKWIIGSDGTSVQVRDPYVIPVGASSSFSVQLQCPLNSNNNWDTVTDLRINQYNYQTGVTSFAGNIYIRRYQSQCPN